MINKENITADTMILLNIRQHLMQLQEYINDMGGLAAALTYNEDDGLPTVESINFINAYTDLAAIYSGLVAAE